MQDAAVVLSKDLLFRFLQSLLWLFGESLGSVVLSLPVGRDGGFAVRGFFQTFIIDLFVFLFRLFLAGVYLLDNEV